MMKNRGLFQALGVGVYCAAIGYFVFNGGIMMDNKPSFLAPVAFLMLFIVSAMVCALIVFYEPYKLFIAKKGKEALELIVQTTLWLFIFATFFILAAFLI